MTGIGDSMDDDFRQMVIDRLRRGEDLPREWARELFPPEKREYELVYHDKQRQEDILAAARAVEIIERHATAVNQRACEKS